MFKHPDVSAVEIARKREYLNLTDILAPVIYHPVPYSTLARLQGLFHQMIRTDLKEVSGLVLPELVALTELRKPEMWFPLRRETAKDQSVVRFQYSMKRTRETNSNAGLSLSAR